MWLSKNVDHGQHTQFHCHAVIDLIGIDSRILRFLGVNWRQTTV